jgi:F-type H+-transporting ATPase subunit b
MLIDWFTVAAQIVNFLILVALLRVFLYNRVIKAMDERERNINARLEAAEQQRQAAEAEAASYRQQQQVFETRQSEMLAQAREKADSQRQQMVTKARQEVERLQARWHQAVRDEQDAFLRDLRQRASQQMYAMARRALTDLAHASLEQQIVAAFLDRLQTLDEAAWQAITTTRQDANQPLVILSAFHLPQASCQKLLKVLRKHLGASVDIRFETSADMICGIELQTDGQKIAWSLAHYLEALEENLAKAFDEEIRESTEAEQNGDPTATRRDGEQT